MQNFDGKVAVITGAASGIGRGLARGCAREGMTLVLADVDEAALAEIASELEAGGARVRAIRTDVRRADEVQALADATVEAFGSVHLVFNNAGVMLGGYSWERTDDDWRWVLDVNFFGVINGMRAFMPILLGQNEPAHMVNTASVAGLTVGPLLAPYIVSKHAVVALSESAHYELATLDTPVRISALCPGAIATGIAESERIRPADRAETRPAESESERAFDEAVKHGVEAGMEPDEVAGIVFEALRQDRFWIFTHEGIFSDAVARRAKSMMDGSDPVYLYDFEQEASRQGESKQGE